MKKKLTLIGFTILGTASFYAQVGINTENPHATLDVASKTTDGSKPEGIIAPRLTGDQIKAGDIQYTSSQKGTIVFATAGVTSPVVGSKTQNIVSEGYYYFDGNFWQKFQSSAADLYTASNGLSLENKDLQLGGNLSKNTLVAQGAYNMAYTSSATTGTSHFTVDGNTFNVNAVNNRVGIGTEAPLTAFQVVGGEARIGGPSSQAGTSDNPILRLHSRANLDGFGGSIVFNENSTAYGYYIQHNTQDGPIWGRDAMTFGAFGGGSHAFTPQRPGLSINGYQNVGIGTNSVDTYIKLHIDAAEDNNILALPTTLQIDNDVVVTTEGKVGIGTISPSSKLEVNGASTNSASYNAGSGTDIDFSKSNFAYTTASAGTFNLKEIKDSGTYTLSVRGTTSGTSNFTASGFTVKYVSNGPTMEGKETLYTILTIGTTVYIYMATGF